MVPGRLAVAVVGKAVVAGADVHGAEDFAQHFVRVAAIALTHLIHGLGELASAASARAAASRERR